MAIVQNPIIGRAKGQAGGMVFTTLNGRNILKAKPASYRDAATPVQIENRRILTLIASMSTSLKLGARSLFLRQPTDMTASAKISQQLQNMVDRRSIPYGFHMQGKEIGSGNFSLPISDATYAAGSGVLSISFDSTYIPLMDSLTVPVYCTIFDKSSNSFIAIALPFTTLAEHDGAVSLQSGLVAANLSVFIATTAVKAGSDLQKNVKIFAQVTI